MGLPPRALPNPLIMGGPDRPSTPAPWFTAAAVVGSAVRHARRPITSGGSHPAASARARSDPAAGPWNAPVPKYSSNHSSTGTPADSARVRTKRTAARALASASGHE